MLNKSGRGSGSIAAAFSQHIAIVIRTGTMIGRWKNQS
jgi:hypothetical protein